MAVRRSRSTTLLAGVAALAVVAAAFLGARLVIDHHARRDVDRSPHVAAHTTPIVRTTLANTLTATGTIGFVHPQPLRGVGTGVITELPRVGATTKRGAVLYRVDDQPVAVFYGATPLFRMIDRIGVTGSDVAVLADNLHRLGYYDGYQPDDPHRAVFTRLLRADLKDWQRAVGATPTGSMAPGQVLVLPGRRRIGAVTAALGDPAAERIATLTGSDKIITGRGPANMSNGRGRLTLPDGTAIDALVTVSDSSAGQPAFTARPTHANALAHVDRGSVTVTMTIEIHRNVLAVPIVALLALQGGTRYALEQPDGQLIAVQTGMFTSDMVEVTGSGLQVGQRVVSAS